MNRRRILPVLLVLSSLACNYVMRAFGDSVSTPQAQAPAGLAPVYIPPACKDVPLATVPAATALAVPTPILRANPDVPLDVQKRVFDEAVRDVNDVYVYPDFNGQDWTQITNKSRSRIDSGLSTEDFYREMESMISALNDEHSHFESPVEVAASSAELAGTDEYVGIGVYITSLIDKVRVSVISIFPDSPAEHSGLNPHDSLLAVDGIPIVQNGKERSEIILGVECSATILTVQSPGESPRNVMLVRQRIHSSQTIETSLLPTKDGSRVAYISLPTFFDENIPGQVADALEKFGDLDGLILDNRFNGGGSSDVFEPVLSYFASGTLGQFVSRSDSRSLRIEPHPIHNSQTVPLVVLVGTDTVSFGEIFSGVMKDSGRAKIVGKTTLGNVEVLHGYSLDDGSRLWIAEETFVPAHSKENWELTGIIPDVEAYADWDTFTFETDPAIAAALKLLGH